MTAHRFFQLDVFADTPLAGNPLAVFPDAPDLDATTMQAIAREMNLSETTFVSPSDQATRRVRFFTPAAEIPLAGHPTIGTWWLLAELGVIPAPPDGVSRVTQETGAGVLPVEIATTGGRPSLVTMTQTQPQFGATVDDLDALARALGGPRAALTTDPAPQVVSTALPQMMIPFGDPETLARLPSGGNGMELANLLDSYGTQCAMCFTLSEGMARCRMFAPGLGVPEDPATGSAAGALGAYLVRHGLAAADDGHVEISVIQGVEIGRPSQITVRVTGRAEAISRVQVGGQAVTVIEGTLTLSR